MKKGKIIVIEGSDGAGKTTQLALLKDYLKKNNTDFFLHDFPQYETSFFGKFIGDFLNNEYGPVLDVSPYFVSFPFAADRFLAKELLLTKKNEGNIVLLDRYVGSNASYQGARLPESQQNKFIKWLYEMEYNVFKIPKEDLVIFLYVPIDIAQKLILARSRKEYLDAGKKKDVYEKDIEFQKKVSAIYKNFCKKFDNWVLIDCTKNGKILSREEIHEKVIDILKSKKII